MTQASQRLRWAVETLAVHSHERLLEVGCGQGVAVSLVCERLQTGRVYGIDRSAAMVALARRRNRAHVASGRAVLRTAALETADLAGERFDTVFAVNVDLLRREPARVLEVVRGVLRPHGRLALFLQPPVEVKVQRFAEETPQVLQAHGFRVQAVSVADLTPVRGVCVVARPG